MRRTTTVAIGVLLLAATAGLTSSGTLLAFSQRELPGRAQRTLTFADRVAYQRAIEEVYWRHRSGRKAPRAQAIARCGHVSGAARKESRRLSAQLQALEDYWQRPITAGQLQAEMDRIASTPNSLKCCAKSLPRSGTIPLSSRSVWPGRR